MISLLNKGLREIKLSLIDSITIYNFAKSLLQNLGLNIKQKVYWKEKEMNRAIIEQLQLQETNLSRKEIEMSKNFVLSQTRVLYQIFLQLRFSNCLLLNDLEIEIFSMSLNQLILSLEQSINGFKEQLPTVTNLISRFFLEKILLKFLKRARKNLKLNAFLKELSLKKNRQILDLFS